MWAIFALSILSKGRARMVQNLLTLSNLDAQTQQSSRLAVHKSSPSNPCTNVPLECPLCREGSDAVWKYNLHSHIMSVHPTADILQYKSLYKLDPHEHAAMKELYDAKPWLSKKRLKTATGIKISEAHSSRRALK